MQIRMKTAMAGKDFSLATGEVTDRFPDAEAKRLIEGGIAVKATKADKSTAGLKDEIKTLTAARDNLAKANEVLQTELHEAKQTIVALEAQLDAVNAPTADDASEDEANA